jgi:trigger factor
MKTEFVDVSPTRKQLVFEVAPDVVESELDRVTRDYGKAARIPGFRPGKAPPRIVRQRYKDQILHDVMHDLIPRAIDEALRERALEPVDTPDVRDVTIDEGQPLKFTAAFETVPPIDEVDYSSITLRRSPIQIADEAVTSALERLRGRNARHEPVQDRPSQPGDLLTADLSRRVLRPGSNEGGSVEPGVERPPSSGVERHENITIEIGGAANPPGFDIEITGQPAGTERNFVITFPTDYPIAELAGSEVEYSVAIKAIKQKILPALDDEFAKDLGEYDSLETLRGRVRADLLREAEQSQEREVRADLLRQLAGRVSFEVPEALIDREVDRRTEELVRQLVEQRMDPLRVGIDWEDFRGRQREGAGETVKSLLVLDDIARREQVTVSKGELDAEVARLAERTGRSPAVIRAQLEKEGGLGRMQTLMRRDKTVELVMARATIVRV